MSAVRLQGQQAEEWIITATLPALAVANTTTACTIQRQAGQAFLATQQAPGREMWHVEDIYAVVVSVPDCRFRFLVDGAPQPFTPMITSIQLVLLSRLRLPRTIVIGQGSVISAELINVAAVGAVPHVVNLRAKVMRYPVA